LTHHEREPIETPGGTAFTFVTDGLFRRAQLVHLARAARSDHDAPG